MLGEGARKENRIRKEREGGLRVKRRKIRKIIHLRGSPTSIFCFGTLFLNLVFLFFDVGNNLRGVILSICKEKEARRTVTRREGVNNGKPFIITRPADAKTPAERNHAYWKGTMI